VVARGRSGTGIVVLLGWLVACEPSGAERHALGSGGSRHTGPDAALPPCGLLRDRLCSQFGPGSDECRMAEEQTRSFSPGRCSTMLSRYDETAQAAARFVEGRRALISPEQNTSHGPAPSIGSPGAPITMVFFGDFDSPECARGAPIATAVKNLHRDKVRLVFRQFPLSGNPNSHLAAEASLAAHAQGKFWRLYEVMFGNPQAHDRGALERYAKAAELDLAAFDEALDDHEFSADVDADRDLGKKVDVSALPALFVNGRRVSFPFGEAELARVIADAPVPRFD
jgi:hypothetical protein